MIAAFFSKSDNIATVPLDDHKIFSMVYNNFSRKVVPEL